MYAHRYVCVFVCVSVSLCILTHSNNLNQLTFDFSIISVRKLSKPPHLIMRIMDCVLLLFQRKVEPITMDPERSCPKPSWIEAQKLMSSGQFLQGLLTFPKVITIFFLHFLSYLFSSLSFLLLLSSFKKVNILLIM